MNIPQQSFRQYLQNRYIKTFKIANFLEIIKIKYRGHKYNVKTQTSFISPQYSSTCDITALYLYHLT